MINKLILNFEHCYGIKSLDTEISFDHGSVAAIYSPNGSMKTSFAQVFKDLSNDELPKDRIHKDSVTTVCEVCDQDGVLIPPANIFVIESLNDTFESKRRSSLLVNKDLKKEYDDISENILEKKDNLFKKMRKLSGLSKDSEEAFCDAANVIEKDIFKGLARYDRDVKNEEANPDLSAVKYKLVFNPQVELFLSDEEVVENIAHYTESYNALIDQSTYFRRGIFNHNNAITIAGNLKKNGWFKSGHSVNMKSNGENELVRTQEELVAIIQLEKEKILNDVALQTTFDKINKLGDKNIATRDFIKLISNNRFLIPAFSDLNKLKIDLWVSYLQSNKVEYEEWLDAYDSGKKRLAEIIEVANTERTKWAAVIDQFNERFKVPFQITMKNQDDVILKREAPLLGYIFKNLEDDRTAVVDEKGLKEVLSNGEKRALYILNIIFEVEARIAENIETLFIIDDIADSFDYKNKYAIIEYLKDISKNPLFKSIILTHNFDFYRTVKSRLNVYGNQKRVSTRDSQGITLVEDNFTDNPFAKWRDALNEKGNVIASIPFVRNLAEFSGNSEIYNKLTKLLHIKPDTKEIKMSELQENFKAVLHNSIDVTLPQLGNNVLDVIYSTADEISEHDDDNVQLKDKVILSIAIRLLAEEFMIGAIDDEDWVASLGKFQTGKLFGKFKSKFQDQTSRIELLERVQLMTPENIHINSFMFEPILDMSMAHLKKLYAEIKAA